ncbi:ABC transporter permease [Prevotella sp. PCHR]|uniref:ABC transporter permease n=2 Tax=Xylanibacter caecicola TaxID=2736294 RepID=A0ABX2B168_9BACT|nr:ABC transporter permease [Xylanibacter caecicola]NPE24430.1 ABC transporter permease [Xylanibacter caecicola]
MSMKMLQRINEGLHDMCHIWAEEMKNVVRDEGVLIFFVLVPLLYPILYSWIYNNEVVREVPVAVVDNSHSSMSRMFIREFDASPDTRVAYHCNSLDEAKDLVGRQAVHGVIYFPQDFQTRINRMEQSHVSVYCDMSLMLTYKAIFQTASSVAANINSKIQTSLSGNTTGREDEITIKPLDFDEIPMFNTTGGYGNFILPGVLMLIIQQTLLLGIGLSAGTAREKNKYKELIPVSRHYNGIFRIVLGKSICYFMIYSVIAAYVTLVIPRMFGFVSLVHAPDLVTFMLPYLLSCIFFGMMLSCLVRYRENVILLVVFSSILFLFLSGMSWPSSNIPGTWKAVSWLFPSTFGIQGFVSMNTAGARLGDISLQYICLWIQTVVFFIMTCAVYKFQIDRVKKLRSREQ